MQYYHPRVGEPVLHKGRRCHIKAILDVRSCLLQPDDAESRPESADFSELRPVPEAIEQQNKLAPANSTEVPDLLLACAHKRLKIIGPLIESSTRSAVKAAARACGKDVATLYRWLRQYRRTGMVASLIPAHRKRGAPLKSRLSLDQENILTKAIHDFHLTQERPSMVETALEVASRCRKKGLKAPSPSTVRNRILALSERLVTRERLGPKAASVFSPSVGTLPGADRPWSVVHIDHTKLDLMLVDRETRQPIGRPFITLAEDACTRMVVGFYISLDAPSALSVGLCLSHALLPKEQWMAKRGIVGNWPVWGTPETIHTDNAQEFHGKMLEKACEVMGIHLNWRRVGQPQDGGRIERLIGTLGKAIHILPGSTFSNPADRGEYPSEKNAAMTLDEVERYVADWVVNYYHQREHRGLGGKSPLKAWEEGLLGTGSSPGTGLPPRHTDEEAIRLRFLPFEKRTVQKYGVVIDDITYWNDHLRLLIGEREPDQRHRLRKYEVRRDPRDLTRVWLYDPLPQTHVELAFRHPSRSSLSLWELNAIKRELREKKSPINEELIFSTRDRLREQAAQSKRDTKAIRRERERKKHRDEGASESFPKGAASPSVSFGEFTLPQGPRRSPRELAFDDIIN